LFACEPEGTYDAVCFGFGLSHVPVERLDEFVATVAPALRPGGLLFFADSLSEATALHDNHRVPGKSAQIMARTLANGQTYQIVKNYHDAASLSARFLRAELDVDVQQTAT
jgi:demethylmenaquinone methyltransferase/2-methoxy-6-polyprenyl-1,4-benzoquinol methylase